MNVNKNIKKFRRNRDMTQEQLADYMGVSVSAVSQWELGKTMPDITMIPSLCSLFQVASDELLGIDNSNREKEIDAMLAEAYAVFDENRHEDALNMMRDMLKRYPDSYRLMDDLAACLSGLVDSGKIDRNAGRAEICTYIDRILADCTETPIRNSAITTACIVYPKVGRMDEAIALANSMLGARSGLDLLSIIHTGQNKIDTIRSRIWWQYNDFQGTISELAYTTDENGNYILSEDDRLTLFKKRFMLADAVFENEDYLFFSHWLDSGCKELAEIYAHRHDVENTIKYMAASVKYAKIHDTYEPGTKYTSVLLRGIAADSEYRYGTTSCAENLKWYREDSCFDFIRDDERFHAIIRDLEDIVNKVKVAAASATRDRNSTK